MGNILCWNVHVAFILPCTVSKLSQLIFQLGINQGHFQKQHGQGSLNVSQYLTIGGWEFEELTIFDARDVFVVSPFNNTYLWYIVISIFVIV